MYDYVHTPQIFSLYQSEASCLPDQESLDTHFEKEASDFASLCRASPSYFLEILPKFHEKFDIATL